MVSSLVLLSMLSWSTYISSNSSIGRLDTSTLWTSPWTELDITSAGGVSPGFRYVVSLFYVLRSNHRQLIYILRSIHRQLIYVLQTNHCNFRCFIHFLPTFLWLIQLKFPILELLPFFYLGFSHYSWTTWLTTRRKSSRYQSITQACLTISIILYSIFQVSGGECSIWGRKAKFIPVEYKTHEGKKKKSKLLIRFSRIVSN